MDKIRTIAMYLPQFHQIAENDAWWGEGFTEWTAVRAAKALFPGHQQPRIPLNENYYDLTKKQSLMWQAELANEYGIDGMCFYHYWFGENRLLLEQPAENLLQWKDIKMPFCFAWAIGTWARTWSNSGNWSWTPKFDRKVVAKLEESSMENDVLIEQTFGEKNDWLAHIRYLLPFFQDKRYIKIDGKPIFVLYGADIAYCLRDIISCWREYLLKEGIPGLYIINNSQYVDLPGVDAALRLRNGARSIMYRLADEIPGTKIFSVNYDCLWEEYLHEPKVPGQKIYYCLTVNYDDTPRRGEEGLIFSGDSPERFAYYYRKMLQMSQEEGNEILFLNAWNEWGEGMYLEPDTVHGYAYLEKVREVQEQMSQVSSVDSDMVSKMSWKDFANLELMKAYSNKRDYWLLHRWLQNTERGLSVADFFITRHYQRIAIYGISYLCRHLEAALQETKIELAYGIDRQGNSVTGNLKVYKLEDEFPTVDAVVVTIVNEFELVRRQLQKKLTCPIISLEEVIYTL